jgi:signal-transduction protein with cAMP-binding, CBS, and nucleotidyltransferase domain
MGIMTTHRVRHLPVIEAGQLYGMLSIGDVVKAQHDELEMENHHMRSYIQGGTGSAVAPL